MNGLIKCNYRAVNCINYTHGSCKALCEQFHDPICPFYKSITEYKMQVKKCQARLRKLRFIDNE